MSDNTKPKKGRRGRPRTQTDEQRAAAGRARVQRYRSRGVRLDLQVSTQCARELDRLCTALRTTRRRVIEALVTIAVRSGDTTMLRAALRADGSKADEIDV